MVVLSQIHEWTGGEDFAPVLRAAIAGSELTLEGIRQRLARNGAEVSAATLSYWQSGRRRPGTPESLRVVAGLEEVLRLPSGTLRSLVGPPPRRGRGPRVDGLPTMVDLWPGSNARPVLDGVDLESDAALLRLVQHDTVTVNRAGRAVVWRTTQVMRALVDDVDRWTLMFDWCCRPGLPVTVTDLRNCALGVVVTTPVSSVFAAELVFPRPLRRGETVLVGYELRNPEPTNHWGVDKVTRKFRRQIRQYVLDVRFDPTAPPERCQEVVYGIGQTDPSRVRVAAPRPSVHLVATHFGPGKAGFRWWTRPR